MNLRSLNAPIPTPSTCLLIEWGSVSLCQELINTLTNSHFLDDFRWSTIVRRVGIERITREIHESLWIASSCLSHPKFWEDEEFEQFQISLCKLIRIKRRFSWKTLITTRSREINFPFLMIRLEEPSDEHRDENRWSPAWLARDDVKELKRCFFDRF